MFPSPVGTRLAYKKKGQQDYFEMMKKKKEEAVQKSLFNYGLAKEANQAMTDTPLQGSLKELKRGGRADRKQP